MKHLQFGFSAIAALILALQGCGQDPSFLELYDGDGSPRKPKDGNISSADSNGAQAVDLDGDGIPDDWNGDGIDDDADNDGIPDDMDGDGISDYLQQETGGSGAGSGTGTNGNTNGQNGTGNTPPAYNIPKASNDDLAALHKCLSKWRDLPFGSTIGNYRKIYASVIVGGSGIAVRDTERTSEPFLVLITAAVNVNSQVEYELLNPNGYYCIKVGVNVNTDLDVNLHCNARLADSLVDVNVGSTTNGNTASVGVNVNSNVTVNTVRPFGDECVR